MVINSLKAVFFIAGGAVVAGGAAYVTGALDGFFPEKPAEIASLPAPQPAPSAVEPQAVAPKVEEGTAPVVEEADSPQEAESEVIVPTFDIVRVEPDGSLVIAGRAAPVANIEIVTGANAIGRGESNEAGDFAIVLDQPLKPGDYTIVLRSTTRDAIVATSSETAIVSIPEHPSGQVLALVEQPGAPSRLITVPEAPAQKQDRATSAAEQPATEVASASPKKEASAEQEVSAAEDVSVAEDEPVTEGEAVAEGEEELAGAPAASVPSADEPQVAAISEPQPAPEKAASPAGSPRIAVEAVEIEGSRVFVAGRAEVGSRVRVYANDILLGDAQASEGGRFLVEAERDLPVGDYIVRADLLGRNAEVLARAAVPFAREPGESVAAVAAPEPQSAVQQPATQAPQAQSDAAAAGSGAGQASAQQEVASAPAAPVATDSAPAAQSETAADTDVTGPKLQNVAGSVIIRRGDTLWHISKRVYGQGVRYTTIYLANQDQIADPDRIWPGQIFSVPDKTDRGENADMSTIADRIPEGQAETR